MARTARQTVAGAALEKVLAERGPAADALIAAYNRSHLYNLYKGFRGPSNRTALKIQQLTEGRVRASDWEIPVRRCA